MFTKPRQTGGDPRRPQRGRARQAAPGPAEGRRAHRRGPRDGPGPFGDEEAKGARNRTFGQAHPPAAPTPANGTDPRPAGQETAPNTRQAGQWGRNGATGAGHASRRVGTNSARSAYSPSTAQQHCPRPECPTEAGRPLTDTPSRGSCTRRPHCPAHRHARHSPYSPGSGRYTPDQYLPGRRSSATTSSDRCIS